MTNLQPQAVTGVEDRLLSGPVVRAASDGDADVLRRLAVESGLFEPDDFDEILAGYLDGTLEEHTWIILDYAVDGVLGAAYYAPEPVGDRVWHVCFIAVFTGYQRTGAGSVLIGHVEAELRQRGEGSARVLIVETSSLAGYEQARSFYRKHGFDEEARVREFYGPGDHKVMFWKSLAPNLSSDPSDAPAA